MRRPSKKLIERLSDRQLADLALLIDRERFDRSVAQRRLEEKRSPMPYSTRRELAEELLTATRAKLPQLEALLEEMNGHWIYIDRMYRFYHYSRKVFWLQEHTLQIAETLQTLLPNQRMNLLFLNVLEVGTKRAFHMRRTNKDWLSETLPITAAFLHAKYFLEMAIRCGKAYEHLGQSLPSDLAAFLYLFDLR